MRLTTMGGIDDFLKGSERSRTIEYKGSRLNAACDWQRAKNPARVFLNAVVMEACKKLPSTRLKNALYRMIGVKIGKDVAIAPDVLIDPFFPELIEIKDGALIGWGAKILTHEFTIKHLRVGRVTIGRQALIGCFSTIRSGVEIGDHAVVCADTYVNKDVGDHEEVGGVPEHRIKKIKRAI